MPKKNNATESIKKQIIADNATFGWKTAAVLLDCCESTVRKMVRYGEINHIRTRSGIRFRKEDIDEYIKRHRVIATKK